MIRHTVTFALRHPRGSAQERRFLDDARVLAGIPGVQRFERLTQVSAESALTHGFSMEFDDADAYAAYDAHPEHVAFVRDRWVPEVADFQELDFVELAADPAHEIALAAQQEDAR